MDINSQKTSHNRWEWKNLTILKINSAFSKSSLQHENKHMDNKAKMKKGCKLQLENSNSFKNPIGEQFRSTFYARLMARTHHTQPLQSTSALKSTGKTSKWESIDKINLNINPNIYA